MFPFDIVVSFHYYSTYFLLYSFFLLLISFATCFVSFQSSHGKCGNNPFFFFVSVCFSVPSSHPHQFYHSNKLIYFCNQWAFPRRTTSSPRNSSFDLTAYKESMLFAISSNFNLASVSNRIQFYDKA